MTTTTDTGSIETTVQTYVSLPPNCNMFCRLKPEYREAIIAEKAAKTTINTTVTTAASAIPITTITENTIETTTKSYLSLPPNCNMFCRLKPEYRDRVLQVMVDQREVFKRSDI